MGDTNDSAFNKLSPSAVQTELLTSDELEDGGWSSGFDDSDDDILGSTF